MWAALRMFVGASGKSLASWSLPEMIMIYIYTHSVYIYVYIIYDTILYNIYIGIYIYV